MTILKSAFSLVTFVKSYCLQSKSLDKFPGPSLSDQYSGRSKLLLWFYLEKILVENVSVFFPLCIILFKKVGRRVMSCALSPWTAYHIKTGQKLGGVEASPTHSLGNTGPRHTHWLSFRLLSGYVGPTTDNLDGSYFGVLLPFLGVGVSCSACGVPGWWRQPH